MKQNESNFMIYGIIVGGILSAGIAIIFGTRFISRANKNKRERKHKFFEGIDDIFEPSSKSNPEKDTNIDKETEDGIIDELFSRTI